MSLFRFLNRNDIDSGIKDYLQEREAVLLDVRAPREFRAGYIPGAINVPLQDIESIEDTIENKQMPVYLYCLSGGRSHQAAMTLREMGYTHVRNLGGISAYTGDLEAIS